jgi:transcriptional regulator with XRE-family HTH domain
MSESFGEDIRRARESVGWSQEFLAAKVGATQSTIDRIESGLTRRSRVLPEIAAALNLDLPGYSPAAPSRPLNPTLVKVSYVLPQELVNRIENYKNAIGVSSDDEAARRLIDDALKFRDDHNQIIIRLFDKYKTIKSLREAAGFVIANHPLVKSIEFLDNSLSFEMSNGFKVDLWAHGSASIKKPDGSYYKYFKEDAPEWVSSRNLTSNIAEADEIYF